MKTSDDSSEPQRADDVLEAIYDVALEPSNYEMLSDVWEAKLWPQIETGDAANLETSVFAHFKRAEEFLDLIGLQSEDADLPEIARYVNDITSAAALVFDRDLQIASMNSIGSRLLSTKVGASIADLPIMKNDLDALLTCNQALLDQAEGAKALVRVRRKLTGDLIVFQLRPLHTLSGETFIAAVSTDVQWPDDYRETLDRALGYPPRKATSSACWSIAAALWKSPSCGAGRSARSGTRSRRSSPKLAPAAKRSLSV